MAPSNPKRPPRPPRPPVAAASKKQDVELPFDDDEVAPLQEDDPRPQRVPQYPAGPRRSARSTRGPREGTKDRELATRFDTNEYSDPGYSPVFLYVEKGPGAGQLMPVKQGPLVIGRASVCDLRLQHPSISRRHAQLMRQSERFILRDLGSQNGTFVNKEKVTSDQEIQVGDEIALGNAVMKLRGSGVSSDKVPVAQVLSRASARLGKNRKRTTFIAAAIGSAVAALVALALFKLAGPSHPPPGSEASSTQGASPSSDAATPKAEDAYVPPPPAPEEEQQAAPEEESPRALKAVEPEEETQAPTEHKASGPRASSLGKRSVSHRGSSRVGAKAPPDKAPSGKAPSAKVGNEEIRSRYEKGDVAGALSLARDAQLEPLASKIADFQEAQAAGARALKAKDTAGAIEHFAVAVVVDQELSQGWSIQGRNLRKQLGKLYTQKGQQLLKTGSRDAARESFELALKYDPTNAGAKAALQQLGAGR